MIRPEAFRTLREELEQQDALREEIIKQSRDLLKDAKHAVYLVHQREIRKAQDLLASLKQRHATISPNAVGAYQDALEEYVEAACFVAFVTQDDLPSHTDLGVPAETYLCGLSDLTGELTRRAVFAAIRKDKQEVERIRAFIDALQGELVQFHLRNNLLRKKYDSIKYNLKKVEEILYDLELRA